MSDKHLTHLMRRAMNAAERFFDKGIPYWSSLECYANGWAAGYRAAQAKARSTKQRQTDG